MCVCVCVCTFMCDVTVALLSSCSLVYMVLCAYVMPPAMCIVYIWVAFNTIFYTELNETLNYV